MLIIRTVVLPFTLLLVVTASISSLRAQSFSFIDDQKGWFITEAGIVYQTEDQGQSWVSNNPNVTDNIRYDIAFYNDSSGYLWTKKEVYETENTGTSWQKKIDAFRDLNDEYIQDFNVFNDGSIALQTDEEIHIIRKDQIDPYFTIGVNEYLVGMEFRNDSIGYFYTTSDFYKVFIKDLDYVKWADYTASNTLYEFSLLSDTSFLLHGGIGIGHGNSVHYNTVMYYSENELQDWVLAADFYSEINVSDEGIYSGYESFVSMGDNNIYVLFNINAGFYKYLPNEKTFDPVANNVKGQAMHFVNNEIGFVLHSDVLYKTFDGGITWTCYSLLEDPMVQKICEDLVVTSLKSSSDEELRKYFAISMHDGTLTLSTHSAISRLHIYNINGSSVLIKDYLQTGQTLHFELRPGLYLIRAISNGEFQTEKVLVIDN